MHPIHAAREAGETTYFTGKPCNRGHVADRFVSSRQCVTCANARKRAWAAENQEHVRAYQVAHIEKNRAHINARNKVWREKNPERHKRNKAADYQRRKESVLAASKQWREKNLDKVKAADVAKRAANPERYGAYKRNYKIRKRDAPGSHTGEDIQTLLKAQSGKCAYCRVKLGKKYHVDHILALSKGGANDRTNLQILCARCNQTKSAKDPIVFAQSLGMLL